MRNTFYDEMAQLSEAFCERERQRTHLNEVINPILATLAEAEEQVRAIGVAGEEGRYRVARARMHLMALLHKVHTDAHINSENMNRALEPEPSSAE
ncbi:MAG TPA: hypothetical protein VNJ02_18555 [Vicinamibacterales bacterium]|nr:hypothetical protein [Vicinamibacterales bacterium]